jgi:DNA-binding IclR family transcriptional regulator
VPAKSGQRPRYGAPALEKGLDILELLSESPDGLNQADIAKGLGRTVGEIFRMLDCLVRRQYVTVQRPADTYGLTLKLFELSHRHPPIRRLIDEALPLMKHVTRQTLQACHLAVLHDSNMVVLAQVDNPGDMGFSVRMGAQLRALQTTSGRVILAFHSPAERARLLDDYAGDSGKALDRRALEKQFALIRERGYGEDNSEQVSGVRNISFPVLNFAGDAIAAIAVPYLRRIEDSDENIARIRVLLREAASRLSIAIGARQTERLGPVKRPTQAIDRRRS